MNGNTVIMKLFKEFSAKLKNEKNCSLYIVDRAFEPVMENLNGR